jgi:hypothetical protein
VHNIPPALRPQFEQSVRHLHALGPRATAEALAEIAAKIGGFPAITAVLNDYRCLSVDKLKVTGGDRFPRRPINRVAA